MRNTCQPDTEEKLHKGSFPRTVLLNPVVPGEIKYCHAIFSYQECPKRLILDIKGLSLNKVVKSTQRNSSEVSLSGSAV